MVHYSLNKNPLTGHTNEYIAQVLPSDSCDKASLITRMLRKGTTATQTDIVSILTLLEETVAELTNQGITLNTPLFNTSFSMSGVFESAIDTFDTKRHKLNVKLAKGTLLRDAIADIHLEKTRKVTPQPQLFEVKDSISGKVNEILTSGGVVEVRGNNIRIAGENSDCGLWFVSASGNAAKAQVIAQNKPSLIVAIIPLLAAGSYTIKIVTQYTGGALLKTTKTSSFGKTLTID